MISAKKLLPFTFILFLFISGAVKSQEREADFEDGTKLYYTIIDTTATQMHHIHLNIFSELELSYFRPDKKYWVAGIADWVNSLYGVQGYYFFSEGAKEKMVKAQAKEQYAGANTVKVYSIHMGLQKSIYYAFHGGIYMTNGGGLYSQSTTSLVPEIALGIARVKAWGIKYMIKDPEQKKRSIYTIIAQRIGTVNLDLLVFPVKAKFSDSTITSHSVGARLYVKGFVPFLSHRDFGMFGMAGIQYGITGTLDPLIGFGFSAGWK